MFDEAVLTRASGLGLGDVARAAHKVSSQGGLGLALVERERQLRAAHLRSFLKRKSNMKLISRLYREISGENILKKQRCL